MKHLGYIEIEEWFKKNSPGLEQKFRDAKPSFTAEEVLNLLIYFNDDNQDRVKIERVTKVIRDE